MLFPDRTEELKAIVENRFEEAVSQIESQKDFQVYFDRLFKNFEKKVFQSVTPQSNFHKFLSSLKNKFPKMIETIFLDSSGLPVSQLTDFRLSNYLIQKFFIAYQEFLELAKPFPNTIKGFINTLMGEHFPTEKEFCSRFLIGTGVPHPVYFYVSRCYPQGMFILFFKPVHHPRELVLNKVISKVNKMFPDFRFSLAVENEKIRRVLQRIHAPKSIEASFWKELQRAPTGSFWFENSFVGKRILFPNVWVVGMKTVKLPKSFLYSEEFITFVIQFLVLLFLIIVFFENKWAGSQFSSIRWKIFFVFLFSSFIPLLIMGSSIQSFIQEHRSVLEKETHEKIERSILAFDRGFGIFIKQFEGEIQKFFIDQKDRKALEFNDFLAQAEYLKKSWNFDLCWLIDSKGDVVFEMNPNYPKIVLGSVGRIFKTGIKDTICTTNSRSNFLTNDANLTDQLPGKRTKDYSQPIPAECMSHIKRLIMGSDKIYFGVCPIGTRNDRISHFILLAWRPSNIQWNYVKKQYPDFLRKINSGQGVAWDDENPDNVFPGEFKRKSWIYNSLVKSRIHGFRKISSSGENKNILTGLRGTNLDSISFLIQTSDVEINREIATWVWKFRFMALTVIGLCVVVGSSFSRLFLEPIDKLTKGVSAIAQRNFSFKVPIENHDELGNLGTLFNETMSDLADLEVAKVVQESFFPSHPLINENWEIFGSCISASHVGGDYFDYFQIDESRVLCIMGDVSGHGVGAALVVAMAKGAICHPSTKNNPAEILQQLNGIIISVLKRKKMMTCCIALIDFKMGSMIFSNAGHPYPILMGNDKTIFLEEIGFPLGSRNKNWKAQNKTFPFSPGSSLLFYSDGLVEAVDDFGNPIGYDRLLEKCDTFKVTSVLETEREIRTWHKKISRKSPPDDDISLLLVQSKPVKRNSQL
ncbi:MAG: SpoIIE family protein phosphatase [Candidatus Riflebacteria bacterium]|nr:SpoIIE family protein phosphatase [Candidatus Riflebacteria bacterium]